MKIRDLGLPLIEVKRVTPPVAATDEKEEAER